MIDSYTYYGKKNSRYYAKSLNLYPATMQRLLVECCMGSGNQTANSLYGESVRRIAIEKDRSIYLLNKAIQENPYETIRALEDMVYSKDEYEKARQIADKVNAGTIMADNEVIKAVYGTLVMSFNAMRSGYRDADDNKKKRILDSVPDIVLKLNKAWKGVKIINGDFMDYPQYWTGGRDTFMFADVPYEKKKRGISETRKNAGYICDWSKDEQKKFMDFVIKAQKSGNPSNMMICANFSLDKDGKPENMQEDYYNDNLLKEGFRLVVVEKRTSSVSDKNGKKKPKCEVVYINYTNILGNWSDYEYYDGKDVYGKGGEA